MTTTRAVPTPLQVTAAYAWRLLVVVAAVAVLVYALIKLHVVVIPLIAALFITTFLSPPVGWLERKGWKRSLASVAVFLGALLLVAGLVAVLAPQVARELATMGEAVREGVRQATNYLVESPLDLSRRQIDGYIDEGFEQLQANRDKIASGLLIGAVKAAEFVAETLLTLVLTFFLLKDGPKMWAWFTGHFDGPTAGHVREIGDRAWNTMGAYLRGAALVGVVDAVLIGVALLVVGVPLVAPLMVLQFFGAFFPLVGAVVAGAVATLVALVTQGPLAALIIAVAILVIQQVEGHVLQPVVIGRAVKLHPVVILLALSAGAVLGGVVGAFLAVPVAAIASATGNYANSLRQREPHPHHPTTE